MNPAVGFTMLHFFCPECSGMLLRLETIRGKQPHTDRRPWWCPVCFVVYSFPYWEKHEFN